MTVRISKYIPNGGRNMTEKLKKALESAKTEEAKKAVAEKYKDEINKLSPEELEGIAGGIYRNA